MAEFQSKKLENCFQNSEDYEYQVSISADRLFTLLKAKTQHLRINDKLRRPTFAGQLADGRTQVKGLIGRPLIKVGFDLKSAAKDKADFECWLLSL